MIRLTGQQIFDATQTLATIINEKRPLPTKGVYRVTRMHAKLFPEFNVLNEQRTAKINSYDHKAWVDGRGVICTAEEASLMSGILEQNTVPDDLMPEFVLWWAELASVETDVNIEPIPIDQLCIDGQEGGISFAEFAVLGDLVQG